MTTKVTKVTKVTEVTEVTNKSLFQNHVQQIFVVVLWNANPMTSAKGTRMIKKKAESREVFCFCIDHTTHVIFCLFNREAGYGVCRKDREKKAKALWNVHFGNSKKKPELNVAILQFWGPCTTEEIPLILSFPKRAIWNRPPCWSTNPIPAASDGSRSSVCRCFWRATSFDWQLTVTASSKIFWVLPVLQTRSNCCLRICPAWFTQNDVIFIRFQNV